MRKIFILGAVVTMAVTLVALFYAGAAWAETINLKLAHFMPPKHIQHVESFVPFSQKVEQLTDGRVKIKVYPGGALGGPKQLADAAQKGITDIAFVIPAYVTGRFPRYSVLDLPFMANSAEHATKIIYDLYDRHLASDFEDFKVLWLYTCGPGQIITVDKPVQGAEDIRGMKVRAPTAYMSKALSMLGANPVGMPIAELAVSLQKKVIDGMLGPYSSVPDFRLADLVNYAAETNLYVVPMAVLMNKQKWSALPDFAKKAVDEASGRQWGLHAARTYDMQDADAVKDIERARTLEIHKISESELEKIRQALKALDQDWVETMSAKGIPAGDLLKAAKDSALKTK
jgi:TRAP-type C4-dicarboxylate transport system substrate-binding protein